MGAQLTVREGQIAAFVNEGQLADIFQPGRYRLETQNLPILSTLKGWKYGLVRRLRLRFILSAPGNLPIRSGGPRSQLCCVTRNLVRFACALLAPMFSERVTQRVVARSRRYRRTFHC